MTYIRKSESVGVLSPPSLFPQDIGKLWSSTIAIGISDNWSTYAGNGIVIICSIAGNISRSRNYGLTWSTISTGSGNTLYYVTYVGNGIVIVGDSAGNISRSTDYGLTWSAPIATGLSRVSTLAYAGNGILIAGGVLSGNIVRSTDYGLTWSAPIATGLSALYGSIYVGNGIVIIEDSTGGNIVRSTDYGLTWSAPIATGLSDVYGSIYVGNGIVIIGNSSGSVGRISRSTDYGLTWSVITIGLGIIYLRQFIYVGNGIVIGGDFVSSNVYLSTDYGLTWTPINTGLSSIYTLTYAGNGIIIAGDGGGLVSRSDVSYKEDERASNFPIPYSQLKINDSILTSDINSAEFNVANKLLKLDASAYVPLAQIGDLTNTQIAALAGIAYSKLSLSDSILTSDILSTEFNVANKLLKLDSNAFTPTAQLGSGTPDATTFLRGDQTWTAAGGATPTNLLTPLTPTFSGFSTNPGTLANITDETINQLTTAGVVPTGVYCTIKYDLGSVKTVIAWLFCVPLNAIAMTFEASQNDSNYGFVGQCVNDMVTNILLPLSAPVKARYLIAAFAQSSGGNVSLVGIGMRVYEFKA